VIHPKDFPADAGWSLAFIGTTPPGMTNISTASIHNQHIVLLESLLSAYDTETQTDEILRYWKKGYDYSKTKETAAQ
jgi:hypothetical protein